MKRLVSDDSILLKIWGTTDITLFIFAGASAEFALNKEVDWLFFTGKLPADPIGRLFSTVSYAQQIIFSGESHAHAAIGKINHIHGNVESARHAKIPAEAYKDVLYLLIYYSITAFELLERKLTPAEKDEIVSLFSIIGQRMHLQDIPGNFEEWNVEYQGHLKANLLYSSHTKELFRQYKKHLGIFRYYLLVSLQTLLISDPVKKLLPPGSALSAKLLLTLYKPLRRFSFSQKILQALIPQKFQPQFRLMEKWNTLQVHHEKNYALI